MEDYNSLVGLVNFTQEPLLTVSRVGPHHYYILSFTTSAALHYTVNFLWTCSVPSHVCPTAAMSQASQTTASAPCFFDINFDLWSMVSL